MKQGTRVRITAGGYAGRTATVQRLWTIGSYVVLIDLLSGETLEYVVDKWNMILLEDE